jgi:hypothetical protein
VVTDGSTTEQSDSGRLVPEADLNRLRSTLDSRVATLQREVTQKDMLVSDLSDRLALMQSRLDGLEDAGLADADPAVQQAQRKMRELEAHLADANRRKTALEAIAKQTLFENWALRIAPTDADEQARIVTLLSKARTEAELKEMVGSITAGVRRQAAGTDGTSDEGADQNVDVDRGRGGSRGGAVRITRALLAEHQGDNDWYRAHEAAINDWIARGAPE